MNVEAKPTEELAAAKAKDILHWAVRGWTNDNDFKDAMKKVIDDATDEDMACWLLTASRFTPKLKRILLEALTEIYLEQIEDECDDS